MTTRRKKAKRSSVVDEFLMGIRPWGVYLGKLHVQTVLAVSAEHAVRIARAGNVVPEEWKKGRLRAKLERRRS